MQSSVHQRKSTFPIIFLKIDLNILKDTGYSTHTYAVIPEKKCIGLSCIC